MRIHNPAVIMAGLQDPTCRGGVARLSSLSEDTRVSDREIAILEANHGFVTRYVEEKSKTTYLAVKILKVSAVLWGNEKGKRQIRGQKHPWLNKGTEPIHLSTLTLSLGLYTTSIHAHHFPIWFQQQRSGNSSLVSNGNERLIKTRGNEGGKKC